MTWPHGFPGLAYAAPNGLTIYFAIDPELLAKACRPTRFYLWPTDV
jgi:hypothetical protein